MVNMLYFFLPSLVGVVVFYLIKINKQDIDYLYLYVFQFVVSNILTLIGLVITISFFPFETLPEKMAFLEKYYLVIAIFLNLLIIVICDYQGISVRKGSQRKRITVNRLLFSVGSFVLLFLGMFSVLCSLWVIENFGLVTPEQILYHILAPLEGTNEEFLQSFFINVVLYAFLLTGPIIILFDSPFNGKIVRDNEGLNRQQFGSTGAIKIVKVLSVLLITIISIGTGARVIDAQGFYKYLTSSSTFIADNYVDPQKTTVSFPEKKRNLIYIFVESLETTFVSEELGGKMSENVMKPLTDLAEEGIYFTDGDKQFGGALTLPGSGWTIAGMVAQTAGMPLKVAVGGNEYGQGADDLFLPGATSLGDILDSQGYNQMIMVGSELAFGGREAYLTQHGNYEVFDYNTAKDRQLIPEDYKEWWGFEDGKLFEFAKTEILNKANEEAPFNFTMLTANTHHIDGYLEKEAPERYQEQYENVYAYTADQLVDFVSWLKEQPFYENTSIIISGDHLSMDNSYFERKDMGDYQRQVFSLFLNSQIEVDPSEKRNFSTMDMFPSTLATLGVTIKGNRLGLGTNLFSPTPTLLEEYGFEKTVEQLSQSSNFYNINILKETIADKVIESSED